MHHVSDGPAQPLDLAGSCSSRPCADPAAAAD
jgi:hypothetical protein